MLPKISPFTERKTLGKTSKFAFLGVFIILGAQEFQERYENINVTLSTLLDYITHTYVILPIVLLSTFLPAYAYMQGKRTLKKFNSKNLIDLQKDIDCNLCAHFALNPATQSPITIKMDEKGIHPDDKTTPIPHSVQTHYIIKRVLQENFNPREMKYILQRSVYFTLFSTRPSAHDIMKCASRKR
jgi:hypothetical protein